MSVLPVIAWSAASGIAAIGFAAALDRIAPAPTAAPPAPDAFATERVDPRTARPVPARPPAAPPLSLLPPVPSAAAKVAVTAPDAAPSRLSFENGNKPAPSTRRSGIRAEPLDDLTVTRRIDLRHVPMIGVYR